MSDNFDKYGPWVMLAIAVIGGYFIITGAIGLHRRHEKCERLGGVYAPHVGCIRAEWLIKI